MKQDIKGRCGGMLLLLLFLLPLADQAQTDPIYINGPYFVGAGVSEQWYGNVELGPDAELYIEDGAKILFYGAGLKMNPGAKIYGVDATWTTFTQGAGTGAIVFIQSNPMDGSTVQQTLDGGNSGNPAIGTTNTFSSIEIDNTLGVKLVNTDTRVGGTVTFTSGHLYTDTHDAVLGNSATLSGYDAAKYVVTAGSGHLVKEGLSTAFEFPVGIATGDYTPATVTPSASNTIHVNVDSYGNDAPDQIRPDGVQRSWNIYGNNAGGALISLQHNSVTNQAEFNSTKNFVTRYGTQPNNTGDNQSASGWQVNTQGASSAGSVAGSEARSRNYTSLATSASANEAYFTKATNTLTPLPLVLDQFTGVLQGCGTAKLSWRTLDEENGDWFELEQSTDGISYTVISRVNATGTAGSYSQQVTQGVGSFQYRLRMVSAGGSVYYSGVVLLKSDCGVKEKLEVRGNPVGRGEVLQLRYTTTHNGPAVLLLSDDLGRVYGRQSVVLVSGVNELSWNNTTQLSAGTYYVRILSASGEWVSETRKVQVMR